MALSKDQLAAVKAKAKERGVPAADAIRAAEKLVQGSTPVSTDEADQVTPEKSEGAEGPALSAERFLIGYLPYVTVNEFRSLVLGLDGVKDGDKFTGEWLDLHGPSTATAGDPE